MTIDIQLTPKQFEFHDFCIPNGDAFELSYALFGGAMGGGKSHAICSSAILSCIQEPGSVIAIMRFRKVDLDSTTKQTFLQKVCPEGGELWKALGIHWNKADDVMTLHNTGDERRGIPPSKIMWVGIMSASARVSEAYGKFRSAEYTRVYCDEAYEMPEEVMFELPTRVRFERPNFKYRRGMLFASNPAPNWLREWFINNPLPEYKFIQSKLTDNPYLPAGYAKQFDRMPEYLRKRLKDGDWTAFEGQVWPGGVQSFHKIDTIDPGSLSQSYWNALQTVDPGLNDPTAANWFLYRFDDVMKAVVVLHEYEQNELRVEDHARNFQQIEIQLGLRNWDIKRLIDPEANKRSMAAGGDKNVRSMFAERGLFYQNAYNSTEAKTLSMASLLAWDERRMHPVTGEIGAPGIFFCLPGTERTISAINDMQWDKDRTTSTGAQCWLNRKKHLPDTATYGTAYLDRLMNLDSVAPKRQKPIRYPDNLQMGFEQYA